MAGYYIFIYIYIYICAVKNTNFSADGVLMRPGPESCI